MPRLALCGLNFAPGMAPYRPFEAFELFPELEPLYGIEP